MTSKTLPLSEGVLSYREAGQGEPLVLIHGVGMQSAAWGPQIEALAGTHRVIALDMPGHGGSSPLPQGAGLVDFVAWAAQAIRALDVGPVNLAGHSMGSLIAGGLAVDHPDLILRVALVCGVHRRTEEAREAVIARATAIQAAAANGTPADPQAPLARWFSESWADQAAKALTSQLLADVSPEGYATAYAAFASGDDVYADRLAEIACPMLVLTGEFDPNSTPAMAETMARAAPRGRAFIVPNHRHMVNLTAPETVTEAMRDWLARPVSGADALRPLRDAFGAFMTGVTVVTVDNNGQPLGFTANSFASVSLDPPLLQVSIARTSRNYDAVTRAKGFAINILSEAQKDVSNTFARPVEDRFATVDWKHGPAGSPVIDGTAAWFDCTMHRVIEAGDHAILIGRVVEFENTPAPGLGYFRGAYVQAANGAKAADVGPDVVVSAIIEQAGAVLLVDDTGGGSTLPSRIAGKDGARAALADLLAKTGLSVQPGFIYAVFDDDKRGQSHIAFLCQAATGTPVKGSFVALDDCTLGDVADSALRIMLTRFTEESQIGNFGTYFGTETAGDVRQLVKGGSQ
ncbi:alpha/beta fold hydrolase [Falsirhodobacter xinxiangensis]|uniref:alpha/beta fold hydrolase n=1 Tax=Falsirhodobacter xinxiangensis TaxID=2530049 RepID=UPI0010AAE48E|nr:alpha/beta fold hydrolase [Rhodobacter xinxiangensis]